MVLKLGRPRARVKVSAKKYSSGGEIKPGKKFYAKYIKGVLTQVHPGMQLTSKAMCIMDSFVKDIFDRIATEASRLIQYNEKRTLTAREIQTAVRLILSSTLARHAERNAMQAITLYHASFRQ